MAEQQGRPEVGAVEWFRPGEHEQVEQVLQSLKRLGIGHLRTGYSWAEYVSDSGREWYEWLLPRLAREVEVLPCFMGTPPALGVEPKTSSPPRDPKDYADFIDLVISRLGDHFDWVEFWNEPNKLTNWDWRMDSDWEIFRRMVAMAGAWCHKRGKKTVLAGTCPTDPLWLDVLARNGALHHFDAVGVHGFPGTWECDWADWGVPLSKIRRVLAWHEVEAEIWITEAGYSTWNHDEFAQLEAFVKLLETPVERLYWYSTRDIHPDSRYEDEVHSDERRHHLGLLRHDGRPKLLSRFFVKAGLSAASDLARLASRHAVKPSNNAALPSANGHAEEAHLHQPTNGSAKIAAEFRAVVHTNGSSARRREHVLITGGAGFIGINVAVRHLEEGRRVRIFDSLARPGVETNLEWLCNRYGDQVEVQLEDIRNLRAVKEAVKHADRVFHFAAQVAVTTSVDQPRDDFEVNAQGTFNLLEALRTLSDPPPLLFTSTNKVYGSLADLQLTADGSRYHPVNPRENAIAENRPLDFESPYGCSKGAADQYVLDYSRMYDLPNVVFRMSCIYGPHQFGTEDQGWVAHFLIRALQDEPIIIYGDGRQVRDLLFVDDLVDGMMAAMANIQRIKGRAFNMGGGSENAASLLNVLELIAKIQGDQPEVSFQDWRPGDQKYYVSSFDAFNRVTGWQPAVNVRDGIGRLNEWLTEAAPIAKPQLSI